MQLGVMIIKGWLVLIYCKSNLIKQISFVKAHKTCYITFILVVKFEWEPCPYIHHLSNRSPYIYCWYWKFIWFKFQMSNTWSTSKSCWSGHSHLHLHKLQSFHFYKRKIKIMLINHAASRRTWSTLLIY